MKYIRGNIAEANESSFHGWIAGHMQTDIAQTSNLEIKLWYYPDDLEYPRKEFSGTECIVIFGGSIVLYLEKDGVTETIELVGRKGEYVVLEPRTIKRVEVKERPAFGVTVRWPSFLGVNRIV